MQYRKTSIADVRLREEKEQQECTFHPKIIDNPFVSEKTLSKYGEATPASAMLRKNKRATSPPDRRNGPGLLAGMYTAAGGLKRGPPEKPGIPMYYFDPFSPPNFATGTYGAPQVITQIIQPPVAVPVAAPAPPPLPAVPAAPKNELTAPPLPPWLGKAGGGGGKPAGNTVPKLVIQKKEKPAAAEEPSGWQAVLLEMQRRANKRNGGDGGETKEKEKKMEPPKPQPKPKRTLGKKKEFKDPVEELKYKFALKRGEIQEDDGDDGEEEGDGKDSAVADAKPAAKKVDIAAMLAKRNAPATTASATVPAPATSSIPSAAATGNGGNKAVNSTGKKIPLAPPIPSSWPPQPCKEVITCASTASASASSTAKATDDAGGGKKSGFAGAAAALMAALANRGKSNTSADTPSADAVTNTTTTSPAPPAATSTITSTGTATVSGPPVIVTLKPGEAVPEGVEARTVTVPGSHVLPDGYYLAANSHILVAPYEILSAGETTVSLILQLTAQMDPENAFKQPHSPHNDEDDVLIDQLGSQPGDHNIAKLSRRLTASDLPVPAGYVQAVSRMQRNAQQRQQKRQQLQQMELRNYTPSLHNASTSSEYLIDHIGSTTNNNVNATVDLSFLTSQENKGHLNRSNNSSSIFNSLNSNSKALQTSDRLYSKHTKAFQQYTTITQTASNINNNVHGSDEHKGLDFGGSRWFQSLRSSSTPTNSSSTTTNNLHQSFSHTSSFNHTTSNSLHLSQLHLQQTQQHLLNQSQISATQPKDPNFLTDSIVARRQQERAVQQQLQIQEERNKLLEQKKKRQEQLLKLKNNLSLRYETLQVKAKKYQNMLQSHRKQLPASVRVDVNNKLQVILKEMEEVTSQMSLSHSQSTSNLHQMKYHQNERAVMSHTTTSVEGRDRSFNAQLLRPHSAQSTSSKNSLSVTTAPSHHQLRSSRLVSQPPAQPSTPVTYHHPAIDMDNNANYTNTTFCSGNNNNNSSTALSRMPVDFDEGVYYYADFPSMPLLSPYHPPQLHVNTHRYGQNECTFEDDQDASMYYEQDDGYASQGYGKSNQQLNHYNFQQYNNNIDYQEDNYIDYS